jgi:hypothetical protein
MPYLPVAFVGWLAGLVLALALITAFGPNWIVAMILGGGLSLAGWVIGALVWIKWRYG